MTFYSREVILSDFRNDSDLKYFLHLVTILFVNKNMYISLKTCMYNKEKNNVLTGNELCDEEICTE